MLCLEVWRAPSSDIHKYFSAQLKKSIVYSRSGKPLRSRSLPNWLLIKQVFPDSRALFSVIQSLCRQLYLDSYADSIVIYLVVVDKEAP